jgi:hypothetical protein
VKRTASIITAVALAVSAAPALAGQGGGHAGGHGLAAHLARVDAKVARYAARCHVATPAANCDARKAKLTVRLTAFETRLDARIARAKTADRKATLQAARDHVAGLLASL